MLVNSYIVLSFFSMASHLLTAIIIPLPRSWAIPAILASCSVTPSVASITRMAISHLSTAATVLIILYLSKIFFYLALSSQPCSINEYIFFLVICYSCIYRISCCSRNIRYNYPVLSKELINN